MAENPYAPPKAEINKGAPAEIARPAMKMPGTVIAAFVLVSFNAAWGLFAGFAMGDFPMFRVAIYTLLAVGFLRGQALAWQWGIGFPILIIVLMSFVWTQFSRLEMAHLAGVTFGIALLMPIPILLWLRRSRMFFGLQCPKCSETSARPRSFLFTRRQCNACKFEWTPVRR